MTEYRTLHERFRETVARGGDRIALEDAEGRRIDYAELGELAAGTRAFLFDQGVRPDERVGFYLRRSIDAISILLGTLEAGAVYVPVDPSIPPSRAGLVFADCKATLVFVEKSFRRELEAECESAGHRPRFFELDFEDRKTLPLWTLLSAVGPVSKEGPVSRLVQDPAYMLYTSGSTGVPKGVVANHAHADAIVQWCVETLPISENDRFSMVTPFSFAFSILDIHCTLRLGAAGIIIPEALTKTPRELVSYTIGKKITVFAAVPSTLNLMTSSGGLGKTGPSALRLIYFAGEEFPIEQLRQLVNRVPEAAFFNMFGTTETGVCLSYPIPVPVPDSQSRPFPIGRACSNVSTRIQNDLDGQQVNSDEGELWLSGPCVMIGYWNRPELNREKLVRDESGKIWYRTGDLVREVEPGSYLYLSRIDRMIKKHGFRIEPGEVENCLLRHPDIEQAAVLAKPDGSGSVTIIAFVAPRKTGTPSIIDLKKHCAKSLPGYMIPDKIVFLTTLPLSSPSKIDLQKLKAMT